MIINAYKDCPNGLVQPSKPNFEIKIQLIISKLTVLLLYYKFYKINNVYMPKVKFFVLFNNKC
jgi:hypothetical protein